MSQVLTGSVHKEQMYNLVYICNGKKVETLAENKPKGIVRWIKRTKRHSNNYRNGVLTIEKVK